MFIRDIQLPVLTERQQSRIDICRTCEYRIKTKALKLELEKCRLCGCLIHMLALDPNGCSAGKWNRSGL